MVQRLAASISSVSNGADLADFITNVSSNLTVEMEILDLPETQLCSPCIIAIFKHQQSTPFSNYNDNMSAAWASVQEKCNISEPTAVLPLYAVVTDKPGHIAGNPHPPTPICLSGKFYIVQSGEDAQSIASAQRVSTGTLRILNGILPDGSNLFAGAKLCLPHTCSAFLVQPGGQRDRLVLKDYTDSSYRHMLETSHGT